MRIKLPDHILPWILTTYLLLGAGNDAMLWGQSQSIRFQYNDQGKRYTGKIFATLDKVSPREYKVNFQVGWNNKQADYWFIHILPRHIVGAKGFKIETLSNGRYQPFYQGIQFHNGHQMRLLASEYNLPFQVNISFDLTQKNSDSLYTLRTLYNQGKASQPYFHFSAIKSEKKKSIYFFKDQIRLEQPTKIGGKGKIIFETKNNGHTYFMVNPDDKQGVTSRTTKATKSKRFEMEVSPGTYFAQIAYPSVSITRLEKRIRIQSFEAVQSPGPQDRIRFRQENGKVALHFTSRYQQGFTYFGITPLQNGQPNKQHTQITSSNSGSWQVTLPANNYLATIAYPRQTDVKMRKNIWGKPTHKTKDNQIVTPPDTARTPQQVEKVQPNNGVNLQKQQLIFGVFAMLVIALIIIFKRNKPSKNH